jgi:hypothetical protein
MPRRLTRGKKMAPKNKKCVNLIKDYQVCKGARKHDKWEKLSNIYLPKTNSLRIDRL